MFFNCCEVRHVWPIRCMFVSHEHCARWCICRVPVLAGCMPTAPILFESFLDTIFSILPPLFTSGFIFSDRDIIFRCRPQGPHRAPLVPVFRIRPLSQCREICSGRAGFRACHPPFLCYPNATISASIFRFMSHHPVYPFFFSYIHLRQWSRASSSVFSSVVIVQGLRPS